MHLKNVNVKNPKNVLVQIPSFITSMKWGLKENDELEVFISDDERSVIIRPKKLQVGSYPYIQGDGVAGTSTETTPL